MATRGIILFAHGSRDPLWHRPIEAVAARIGAIDTEAAVACAYLELSTPDLAAAAGGLIAQGLSRISIVPLFLGVGKHAREDLPLLLQALRAQHPAVQFDLQPAIGEDQRMIDLMARIATG